MQRIVEWKIGSSRHSGYKRHGFLFQIVEDDSCSALHTVSFSEGLPADLFHPAGCADGIVSLRRRNEYYDHEDQDQCIHCAGHLKPRKLQSQESSFKFLALIYIF